MRLQPVESVEKMLCSALSDSDKSSIDQKQGVVTLVWKEQYKSLKLSWKDRGLNRKKAA